MLFFDAACSDAAPKEDVRADDANFAHNASSGPALSRSEHSFRFRRDLIALRSSSLPIRRLAND